MRNKNPRSKEVAIQSLMQALEIMVGFELGVRCAARTEKKAFNHFLFGFLKVRLKESQFLLDMMRNYKAQQSRHAYLIAIQTASRSTGSTRERFWSDVTRMVQDISVPASKQFKQPPPWQPDKFYQIQRRTCVKA